ncbi:uncharacterized protein N7511_008738 [Penicillium nucicola]|uniref:uncharacterized protein n=1 Tax=Penicillium nucicola TaxID=1850975 RepID=UPI0025456F94|nr:uncharacterized protein N7511_008738 [Penicillium nucicola]KAJ5747042.1 hypothetical protein N7511_008738 [Penicillium nucicola]
MPVSTKIETARFGFPKKTGYSVSHWLQSAKEDPLLIHRTTSELPATADVVIIGSGMSGTLMAKHVMATWPEKTVVVLEARQFCSGATGRNAGHCKPDQWRGFRGWEGAFGTEQALKILQNEQETWSNVVHYITENNVDCELWVGDTLNVPMTDEAAKIAQETFDSYHAAGGNVDHIKVTHDPTLAAEKSQIKDAKACYAWPASTLNPWKLAAHLMRENLKKGLNLQTNTLVTGIQSSQNSVGNWIVKSDRGDIECPQVIHATNAYSSALEPSLRGIIIPSPHICTKVTPPSENKSYAKLNNSYGIMMPKGDLITIDPRATEECPVLFGGSNPGQHSFQQWLHEHPDQYIDDGIVEFEPITGAVREFAERQLEGWSIDDNNNDSACMSSWSGIIGYASVEFDNFHENVLIIGQTLDKVPFVGEIPGLGGQWICAGHNGHGMARIFTAAPALVKLMKGCSWAETKLPEVFQITQSRLDRLKTPLKNKRDVITRL